MVIYTKFNPGEKVWFFNKDNAPIQKEVKSINFYKDKVREELFYAIVSDNRIYLESELFNTQQELYASLN